MADPLTEVVTLLQPRMAHSKVASGAGRWGLNRIEFGMPSYFVLLEGRARLMPEGMEPLVLEAHDFVLIPSTLKFTMTSFDPPDDDRLDGMPVTLPNGEYRHGDPRAPADVRILVGMCHLESPDAALLVSLLPKMVLVRGETRLSVLVQLVIDESRSQRAARDVVLERLLEVLLIEALRSSREAITSPGLLRGLADARLAVALRNFHEKPGQPWTVAMLARAAAMSRSTFFERFTQAIGLAPMEYVLSWRMALAKSLLRRTKSSVAAVATQVGYGSASTFTVAFTRHVGISPGVFARRPQAG
ncbi:AraC family transcriptional regulator [Bordetella ansorpii]|uniref:AraC family transcriptional regulator n=1 Tax=Bordetella ansorpii TaxID=288768 RepID=A0A157SH37_9BORD|nr:AraC family transcriptional regulator [Bordetella ansorpii]SAI69531.1 AraC family transcriptional regulator [Bordetella ansorpii]